MDLNFVKSAAKTKEVINSTLLSIQTKAYNHHSFRKNSLFSAKDKGQIPKDFNEPLTYVSCDVNYQLSEFIEVLQNKILRCKSETFWCEPLCVNFSKLQKDGWCERVKENIGKIRNLSFIVSDWIQENNSQSVGCLYELYYGIKEGKNVSIVMSNHLQDLLIEELQSKMKHGVDQFLESFNIENNRSGNDKEHQRNEEMLKEILSKNKIHDINTTILKFLYKWLKEKIDENLEKADFTNQIRLEISMYYVIFLEEDYDAAIELCRESYGKCVKRFGKDHMLSRQIEINLANAFSQRSQHGEAKVLLEDLLELCTLRLGPLHHETLNAMVLLAACLREQYQYEAAEELLKTSITQQRLSLSKSDPIFHNALYQTGLLYNEMGRWADAEAVLLECFLERQKSLGQAHPDCLLAALKLGDVSHIQGRWDRAETLFRVFSIHGRKVFGRDDPRIQATESKLTNIYIHQNKYENAVPLLKRRIRKLKTEFGPDDLDYLSAINDLGNVFLSLNKPVSAETLFLESMETAGRELGKEHPRYHEYRVNYEKSVLAVQQQEDEAAEERKKKRLSNRAIKMTSWFGPVNTDPGINSSASMDSRSEVTFSKERSISLGSSMFKSSRSIVPTFSTESSISAGEREFTVVNADQFENKNNMLRSAEETTVCVIS